MVSWGTLRANEISTEGLTMQPSTKRLETLMAARRLELGIRTWKDLAARAGVSYETVRALKSGTVIRQDSLYAIERALCWRPGSVQRIREGGEPIPGVATASAGLGGLAAHATGRGSSSDEEWRERIIAEGLAEARKVLDGMDRDDAEQLLDQMRTLVAGWRARRGDRQDRRRNTG